MTIMKNPTAPFERSYWVIPGKFLAGFYPGDRQKDLMMMKLHGLLDCGIYCVINLMEPDERDHDGKPFIDYAHELKKMADGNNSIDFYRMPVRDLHVPTERFMIQILDTIDASLNEDRPVYVHCWGGRGRTGTVVGCWLARHGLAEGEGVLHKIQELRCTDAKADWPSPKMPDQVRIILG